MGIRYCCSGIVGEEAAISKAVSEEEEAIYITLQRTLKFLIIEEQPKES